jgi:hypothetical protein
VCALFWGREITTITLHPRLFRLLRSAFVAGVASLGDDPVLPDEYHGVGRAFAAAVRDAKSGAPFTLIVEDDAQLALLRGSWEIYGGDTSASDDQWGKFATCSASDRPALSITPAMTRSWICVGRNPSARA